MPGNEIKHRDKIKEVDELAKISQKVHAQQKKIAHCHGIFDLLHIGHIRHFEKAKTLGDILVVTITPDEHVNKGSHRPAFNHDLRAEAIASLTCVDYVIINKWPTAVEAIQLLKPDFYVKGAEYRHSENDHTKAILTEEAAVNAVGGKIIFTEEITFSSSKLINQNIPTLSKEAKDFLESFSNNYTSKDIIQYLQKIKSLKILIVGEAIVDEYQYCEAIGKSSKEPTLAVKYVDTEKFGGGILAVANHVANFVEDVSLITCLGKKNSQEEFISQNLNPRIHKTFLHRKDAPTIVKRRFIESYFFTKLLEVYEINDTMNPEETQQLCALLNQQVPKADVVIVVDFGHGMLTPDAINILCNQARFLAVNAQSNAGNLGYHTISKYRKVDYVCTSEPEIRLESRDRQSNLKEMISLLAQKLGSKQIVVTQGKYGCTCYDKKGGFFDLPALAGKVVDRMGAGDTFLSLTAPCAAQGVPIEVIGFIGNVAGAEAVATVGHRKSVEPASLFKHIESLLK